MVNFNGVHTHLGNTRLVLTDEQSTDPTYAATMETANATAEQQVFANISQTRVAKPGAFDSNSGNASVALTNFTGNKIGPSLLLKVMAGDNLSISVSAYYNATSGTNYNVASLAATDLLTNLLSISTGIPVTGSTHATLTDLQNNSGVINTSTQNFLSNRTAPNANVPKAYLNYIFLDDQFMYAGGYAAPVTSASATTAQTLRPNYATVAAPKNGYVYVYVSNESNYNVYFDNLQVVYQHGPIVEDNAYYPFGLTMAGISDRAVKTNYAQNKYRYNGKELQNQEFSDGSGLEEYDYGARMYDPQLGRFGQQDPLCELNRRWSLYVYGNDNPMRFVDPDGMDAEDANQGWANNNDQNNVLAACASCRFKEYFNNDNNGKNDNPWQNWHMSPNDDYASPDRDDRHNEDFFNNGKGPNYIAGDAMGSKSKQSKGKNALTILGSFFAVSRDKTFVGKVIQILSRFTWELPQQLIGVMVAETVNLFGGIDNSYYKNGALVLESNFMGPGNGYTLGNAITVGSGSDPSVISHEYGHVIQSRLFGPAYLAAFALPSGGRAALIQMGLINLNSNEDYLKFYTESFATKLGQKYWHQ